ncbi:MAG: hypothetical protein M1825_000073 [Sarcosagium campestre]|nr:MAG: hypothetical protein M1825_000073 [Sarcosagium campestre]
MSTDCADTELRSLQPQRPPKYRAAPLRTLAPLRCSPHTSKAPSMEPSVASSPGEKGGCLSQSSKGFEPAHKWFKENNRHVRKIAEQPFVDRDPPFFINDEAESGDRSSICVVPSNDQLQGPQSTSDLVFPCQPMSSALGSGHSVLEDFRSVIDDLTVENRRLRHQLSRYEQLHGRGLQEERLFEVRVHGLTTVKKRELEQLLQSLAASVEEPKNTRSSHSYSPSKSKDVTSENPSSTSHSRARRVDSAYASNTNSDRTPAVRFKKGLRTQAGSKDEQVKSYLHDIPASRFPRNPLEMTSVEKEYAVVERLEQLFTGRAPRGGEHSHPIQQQEVSNSAASAERIVNEAMGQQVVSEGARESRIVPAGSDAYPDNADGEQRLSSPDKQSQPLQVMIPSPNETISPSECVSPDQRPTRPLDLDPYRAQHSDEARNYIRHLGLSACTSDADNDGLSEGWIYFNLLISMAQIHTLNVTPSFVRQSIKHHSNNLRLSEDGKMIRWCGNLSNRSRAVRKRTDHVGPMSQFRNGGDDYAEDSNPSKRRKLGLEVQSSHSQGADQFPQPRAVPLTHVADGREMERGQQVTAPFSSQFPLYAPCPGHGGRREARAYQNSQQASSILTDAGEGNNLSGNSSHSRESWSHRQGSALPSDVGAADGPIIFYQRANFCADLSGDPEPLSRVHRSVISYNRMSLDPVGLAGVFSERERYYLDSRRLSYDMASSKDGLIDCGSFHLLSVEEADNEVDQPSTSDLHENFTDSPTIELEGSGIGSTTLTDNFAIFVRRRRISQAREHRERERRSHLKTLHDPHSATVQEVVLSTTLVDLPPAALPSPSYLIGQSFESDSDDFSSMAYSGSSTCALGKSDGKFIESKFVGWNSSESKTGSSGLAGSDDQYDSDSSIDLLAAAKELDPVSIAEREREFDMHTNAALAESLQNGSSAATAGNQSGISDQEDSSSESDSMSLDMSSYIH